MIDYRIKINFQDTKILTSDIELVSGDVGAYKFSFEFYDNGKRVDISNYILSVRAKRADGVVVAGAGSIQDNIAVFVPQNNFYTVPGELYMEIALSDSAGKYATTKIIVASVVQGLGETAIEGADNLSIYVTLLNDVQSKIDQANKLIKETVSVNCTGKVGTGENSFIANEVNKNSATSRNATAIGGGTYAGGMGYTVTAVTDNADGTGAYTLTTVEGIEVGMGYSIRLTSAVYNQGLITNVDPLNNTVTVNNYHHMELEKDPDDLDSYSVENYLSIVGHPELGDKNVGFNAFAIGQGTIASEKDSFAEGRDTMALGQFSHAEGRNTKAGYAAHAEGYGTEALLTAAHAEGQYSKAHGSYSHAEGTRTTASGNNSHAEGESATASSDRSHAEGLKTKASGSASHSEGRSTTASGEYSHAEGYLTTASGSASHSEGTSTMASGSCSHAEGQNTCASGSVSHAEGWESKATGGHSHAEGAATEARGDYSHSEGHRTLAWGKKSHAQGDYTKTSETAVASHAEGHYTIAGSSYQHVQGKFNIEDTKEKYAHIVGGGTSGADRKNIHTLDWSGNAEFVGTVKCNGMILTSPNGTEFKITVDDNGSLKAEAL